MQLLYFILICYGLTQIICYGKIFDEIRPSKEWFGGIGLLFHCTMCMGFHVGGLVYLLSCFSKLFIIEFSIVDMFFMACLSSGTSYILDKLIDDEGLRIK